MSEFLPSKYYLKAKDRDKAAFTQGVIFIDRTTPWEWLQKETGRDLRDHFTLEEVKEVYYASHVRPGTK